MWEVRKRKHIMQKEIHKLQRKLLVCRAGFIYDYCQSDFKKKKNLQASNYHFNASPHQKLDKPTSRILRKMRIGCRWWWSFSWKPCIGLRSNLPRLFFMMLCIPCPNFRKNYPTVCKISLNQILHFCQRRQNVGPA